MITRLCNRRWSVGIVGYPKVRHLTGRVVHRRRQGTSIAGSRSWSSSAHHGKVVGVAKYNPKSRFETLIDGDTGAESQLRGDNPALHLIQQIRDEAHRFAISGHRGERGKPKTVNS